MSSAYPMLPEKLVPTFAGPSVVKKPKPVVPWVPPPPVTVDPPTLSYLPPNERPLTPPVTVDPLPTPPTPPPSQVSPAPLVMNTAPDYRLPPNEKPSPDSRLPPITRDPSTPTPTPPPTSTVPITYQPYTGYTAPDLAAPASTPPPAYVAPQLVLPESLKPMTAEELAQDPSYQFRLNQGIHALENSNAAKGLSRTGGSYKGLIDYAGGAASQEFAAADARRTGVYDRNVDAASRAYAASAEGAGAEFAPKMTGWQQATADAQRNAELAFDRGWQREIYGKDDWQRQQEFNAAQRATAQDEDYRKMVFMADDSFRKAVYSTDDAFRKAVAAESDEWKRTVMMEERQKWLEDLKYKYAAL